MHVAVLALAAVAGYFLRLQSNGNSGESTVPAPCTFVGKPLSCIVSHVSPYGEIKVEAALEATRDGCRQQHKAAGKIHVVREGGCEFNKKIVNAHKGHAAGLFYIGGHQNPAAVQNLASEVAKSTFPVVFLSATEGAQLMQDMKSAEGQVAKISYDDTSRLLTNDQLARYQWDINLSPSWQMELSDSSAHSWPILVNNHSSIRPRQVRVTGADVVAANGIYTVSHHRQNIPVFSMFSPLERRTYTLERDEWRYGKGHMWTLKVNSSVLYMAASNTMHPPLDQWALNSWSPTHVKVEPFRPAMPQQIQQQQAPPAPAPIPKSLLVASEGDLLCPFMLRPSFLARARESYATARPSPHIVLDGLFDPQQLGRIAAAVRTMPAEEWSPVEPGNKYKLHWDRFSALLQQSGPVDPQAVAAAQAAAALRAAYANPRFIEFLQEVSGVPKLRPDMARDGGMLPTTSIIGIPPGGFLALHRDFNRHPSTGLHLRVNVLLYLNPRWEQDHGGLFELCDAERCPQRIVPLLNRLTIFTVTDEAVHGHPDLVATPDGRWRYAVQFQYYSDVPAYNEIRPSHSAVFQYHCANFYMIDWCLKRRSPGWDDEVNCQCSRP